LRSRRSAWTRRTPPAFSSLFRVFGDLREPGPPPVATAIPTNGMDAREVDRDEGSRGACRPRSPAAARVRLRVPAVSRRRRRARKAARHRGCRRSPRRSRRRTRTRGQRGRLACSRPRAGTGLRPAKRHCSRRLRGHSPALGARRLSLCRRLVVRRAEDPTGRRPARPQDGEGCLERPHAFLTDALGPGWRRRTRAPHRPPTRRIVRRVEVRSNVDVPTLHPRK